MISKSRVRILRISTVPHSLNILLRGQFSYIETKGFEVITASSFDSSIPEMEKREGVKHYQLPLSRRISPLLDIWALFKTIQLILRLKPRIVHTHSPKAGLIGMLAAFVCRVPLKIHTVAGLPLVEERGLKKEFLIWVERFVYSCSDYVLSNSLRQKDYITTYIYTHDKVRIIGRGSSNGIDLQYFNRNAFDANYLQILRKDLGILKDSTVLCFVGRLANYKGINELVEAFTILRERYSSLYLLLVGPYEDLNPLKESTIELIQNSKHILSIGHQNDIRPFLSISDFFVFPSYREGFPQSLMQAAAMGLPCIATDINGCNEIIEHERSGLLIKPKDVNAIVDAVEKLILGKSLARNYAERSKEIMENNYDQRAIWDQLSEFYRLKLV